MGHVGAAVSITVDPARLAGYNAFLQEEIEASLRLEPGVLALYAVAAKEVARTGDDSGDCRPCGL